MIINDVYVKLDEIQSLTYYQSGTYWNSGCECLSYTYLLTLKGQKPIKITERTYRELIIELEKLKENK